MLKLLPIPFAESLYGTTCAEIYKRILTVSAANPNMEKYFKSNLILENCQILEPVAFEKFPDDCSEKASFFRTNLSMIQNVQARIVQEFDIKNDILCCLGGDHSVAIGTGAGLSRIVDMSKVGLIWVDAHGDSNSPKTSDSKSVTGYPCAVNNGVGLTEFTDLFGNNFIQKTVHIGCRDIDLLENMDNYLVYSALKVEEFGMAKVVQKALDYLQDCDYIWLSIDIDSLDYIYFEKHETDEPVMAGLTPRELLLIATKVQESGKLKIFEFVQLNDVGKTTNLVVLASRLVETALGLGKYRYGPTNNLPS
jgi:arginase